MLVNFPFVNTTLSSPVRSVTKPWKLPEMVLLVASQELTVMVPF